MSGKYNTKDGNMMYDDAAFHLFVVALLASVWIPMFLYRLIRFFRQSLHVNTPMEDAMTAWCPCSLCQKKADVIQSKSAPRMLRPSNITFTIITITLAILSVGVYRTNLKAEPPFDPFSILGVTQQSSAKDIKRAYRRESVKHHPDKNRNDPSAANRFIKITKAFAALTDETAKENYIKYGNPDGYMGTTLGLGLPECVANSSNTVLFAYFLLLVIIFPVCVGMWWKKRNKQFSNDILTTTFMLYRETLQQTAKFRDLLGAFCASVEFTDLYQSENDEALQKLNEALKRAGKVDIIKKTKTFVESSPAHVQNLFVMSAYLANMEIPKTLQPVLQGLLMKSESLLTAMTDIVGVFQRPDCQAVWEKTFMHGHTLYLGNCISVMQCITQGIDEKSSPLLQIPHLDEREVKYLTGYRGANIRSVYDFMQLDMAEQRSILRGLNDSEFLDVNAFCNRYPSACLNASEAVVEGEEDESVHSGDTVTIRARLTVMRRSGSAFSPHTPNIPFRKEEVWWLWLADQRLMCPIDVKRLQPRMGRGHDGGGASVRKGGGDACCGGGMEDTKGEEGDAEADILAADPRVTIFDVKFEFIAPKAGCYNLEIHAACDCYTGTSKTQLVKMVVKKEVEREEEVRYFDTDEESRESESESDTDYEYMEVTDSEDEEGEDEFGISEEACGDAAG